MSMEEKKVNEVMPEHDIEYVDVENEKIKKDNKVIKFLKSNIMYFTAFIIPVLIMCVIYVWKNIYPFGDEMYLRSDCYHQYAPFLQELYNKLHNGGSLLYSWNIGDGMNFTALFAYYLASPINWILLLIPAGHITEIVSVFIIFKIGLSGFTFSYYLSKHFNSKSMSIAAFSIFYALSSYFAAYSWNIMWLDCMVLLPLIILGLERLVNEGKCLLYCITLGLCVLSNYYISIMICIYCVIYFFYLIFTSKKRYRSFFKLKAFKNFTIYSLIAGGLAMCMVLPEYFLLLTTASGEVDFPTTLINYFSVLDMVSRSLIDVEVSIFDPHNPNIYCTVAIFILIPLYWMNKKINYHEKIFKTSILGFFLLSFNMNVLNYIWHGLHYPNSLPCRQSFIYIFLMLTMCYESVVNLKYVTKKQIYGTLGGALALLMLIEKLYVDDTYDFKIIYLSAGFIILYALLITAYQKNIKNYGFVVYLLFIVIICEATINTNSTALSTTSRSAYLDDNESITELLNDAKLEDTDEFYRTEKIEHRTKNDAAWSNYRGISTFSSTASAGLTDYYKALGFETSFNAYSFYGSTPFTCSIFDIKYLLSEYELEENDTQELFAASEYEDMLLYKNLYTLSLGFMVPENFVDNFDIDAENPFYVQNSFVESATDVPEIFHQIDFTSSGTSATIKPEEDSDVYFYLGVELDTISVTIYDADGDMISNEDYDLDSKMQITHIGEVEAGSTIIVASNDTDSNVTHLNMYCYAFDSEAFIDAYNELSESQMEIDTFEDTHITATVTAKEDGLLYTSIPYDKGWSVYVDGKEVKTTKIKNAMLGVYLNSGEHTIEFKYFPQGLALGITISIASLVVLILISVLPVFLKKKKKEAAVPPVEKEGATS